MRVLQNWNQLRYVLAVARNGSFGSAARELGVSSITVSRNVQALSHELGSHLFKLRDGKWVTTGLGQSVAELADELDVKLGSISSESALQIAKEQNVKINGVSFVNSHFLSQHLGEFKGRNSNLHLELNASDETVNLEAGEADVCLRLSEPSNGNLVRLKIATFPVSIYQKAGEAPADWIGLPKELDWLTEMKMCKNEFGKEPALRVDSYSAMLSAIGNSEFAGALPDCFVSRSLDLVKLPAKHGSPTISRSLWMIYHEGRRSDAAISAIRDWLRSIFRSPNLCLCGACDC